jgi:hypothetical protein
LSCSSSVKQKLSVHDSDTGFSPDSEYITNIFKSAVTSLLVCRLVIEFD